MWRVLTTAVLLAAGLVATPSTGAATETVFDGCGETPQAWHDLRDASFTYSASSFSLRLLACAARPEPSTGSWTLTVHLSGFPVPVRLVGAYQDLGKDVRWSGFRVCAEEHCPVGPDGSGALTPHGQPVEGSPGADRVAAGHARWADVLPPGTTVPESTSWHAEVHRLGVGTEPELLDRLPDSGVTVTRRNPAPVPTRLTVVMRPVGVWSHSGSRQSDGGRLTTVGGKPLDGRFVRLLGTRQVVARYPTVSGGLWGVDHVVSRNTAVTAYFPGDGEHEASQTSYTSLVAAFVSLDLPEFGPSPFTVRRHEPVELRGVVRPRARGSVLVQVQEARPGAAWRMLAWVPLQQGRSDSWYRGTWRPTVRGTYLLRTLWLGGSQAPGDVADGRASVRSVVVA